LNEIVCKTTVFLLFFKRIFFYVKFKTAKLFEAIRYQKLNSAVTSYQVAIFFYFAHGQFLSTYSVSALLFMSFQASIHAAEFAKQLEELRASVHALSTQSQNRSSYFSA
jgi:hypothetical protein